MLKTATIIIVLFLFLSMCSAIANSQSATSIPWAEYDFVTKKYFIGNLKGLKKNTTFCVGMKEARGLRRANCFVKGAAIYNENGEIKGYRGDVYSIIIDDHKVNKNNNGKKDTIRNITRQGSVRTDKRINQ